MNIISLDAKKKKYRMERDGDFYRIVALRNIKDFGVKEGDRGGIVASEKSLSQKGSCWVCKNSKVLGDASISGNVLIKNSRVSGNSVIDASGIIDDSSVVNSVISGDVTIRNNEITNSTIESGKHLEIFDSSTNDSFLKSSGLIENLTMTSSTLEAWRISIAKHKTADMINSVVISDGFMKFRGFFMEDAKLDIKGGLTFRYPMSICDAIVRDGESICCFSDLTFYRDAETNEIKVSTLRFIELDDPNEDANLKFESEMEDDISDWKATAYLLDEKYATAAKKMIANYIGMNFTENKSNEKI